VICGIGELGHGVVHVDEELEGDGSDAGRGRVLLVVGSELTSKPEVGFPDAVVAGIWGPHAGEDLGHGAKVLLHGPLANGAAVGGKLARADLVGEHLKEGDGVPDAGERRVESELSAEEAPLPPVGAVG
jgi:hypothetical protein